MFKAGFHVYTVPSMQFGSPAISPFASMPPPLPNNPFIQLRALQTVDHLASKIDQLTSPTHKRGKFTEEMSTPHTLLSNAHLQFATPGTCSEGSVVTSQLHVPHPPSLHPLCSNVI